MRARVFNSMCYSALILACLILVAPLLHAQKEKRDPLTPAQVDQIRDLGGFPDDRVRLYTKFLDDRAEGIKGLTNRARSAARVSRLDNELQDFTALMDELGSNLDLYSERRSDIRKSLKALSEAAPRWLGILRALPAERGYDLARKEAIESTDDLAGQAGKALIEQEAYFKAHRNESGQEREEPK